MKLETEWIRYGDNGEYSGYVARWGGVKEPMPSIIVLQEIWGVDEHIQDVTRRLAQAGYVAFAPDLFARHGVRPEPLRSERVQEAQGVLNTLPQTHWRDLEQRQIALSQLPESKQKLVSDSLDYLFNLNGMMQDFVKQVVMTSGWLRETYEYSLGQSVASVGFCLGGSLSGLLAANDASLKGAVIFYGSAPSAELIPEIQCPILGFYGEHDKRITDEVPAFGEALFLAGKPFDYHIYADAPHAFFNDTRPSFHIDAARDAFARMLTFLQHVLTKDAS
ncbi:carboxymethylenebutenolidase [Paenibacillus baekrokdamisoli]|uniref:Carboxymethylenebutenolidase n=1 Tax=Paenibacillus baekrokdamisoli TaxID=1712516 RepID=A0A3G9IQL9_9BACL|nr:dienelactone hydrolase family protein [Paenibacillus baekrokdamisoli]MBB3070150.1 carboxymethylenebutenolidase [Paenibacillus baekrokdamisoli]BBH21160.1 carboxymethylenebutenolidase [Paenibacillus baekrokdamisoli]